MRRDAIIVALVAMGALAIISAATGIVWFEVEATRSGWESTAQGAEAACVRTDGVILRGVNSAPIASWALGTGEPSPFGIRLRHWEPGRKCERCARDLKPAGGYPALSGEIELEIEGRPFFTGCMRCLRDAVAATGSGGR